MRWGMLVVAGVWLAAWAVADEWDPLGEMHGAPLVWAVPASAAPTLDGKISAAEWAAAAATTGLFDFTTGQVLPDSPIVFISRGEQALNLLVVAPKEPGRDLKTTATARDGDTYLDDAVEVYLQTPDKHLFQIVVNAAGVIADFRDGDKAWNGRWQAATATVESVPADWRCASGSYWLAELALPYSELGASPGPEAAWLLNIAVDRGRPWAVLGATLGGKYSEVEHFVRLSFPPAGQAFAQLTSLGELTGGELALQGRIVNPGAQPAQATVALDARRQGSSVSHDAYRNVYGAIVNGAQTVTVPAGGSAPIELARKVTDCSIDRLAWRVTVEGMAGPLLARSGKLVVSPPLTLSALTVPSRNVVVANLDCSRMKAPQVALRLTVTDAAGRAVRHKELRTTPRVVELELPTAGLPVGRYQCEAAAEPGGFRSTTSFALAAPPAWLTSTLYDDLGQGDRVPSPWTPVQAAGQSLSAWGRTVRWTSASLLPTSLTTQGQELLTGPLTLQVTVAGKTQAVPLRSFRVTARSKSRVTFAATGAAAGVSFRLDGWMEYDGFVWLNLSATAPRGTRVDALRVQAPLRASHARLLQAFSRALAGAVGDQPIRFPWMGDAAGNIIDFYHWFGTEDLGLGFTYTSLQHWAPASEDNIATLTPGPKSHSYAINLIERPVEVTGRVFRFGLQATPIKPLPGDYGGMLSATYYRDKWRASEQLKPNMDMMLIWPLDTGIMKGLNDPYGLDARRMAEVVNEAHSVGLPLLTMAACPQKVSPSVPELAQYRLEWQTIPDSVLNWNGEPQVQNCGKSATLRKWLFYGWALENVRKFGTDGVYFDGWQAGSIACANPHHGCGWTDAKGQRHSTVPVLEGREFNQRMLLFLQDEGRRRAARRETMATPRPLHYWIHSWEFVPSVMGFATEWLTGEFAGWPLHGPSMLTPEGTYGKCLGLDFFRARCLSTNWGVPNLFDALMWEHEQDTPKERQTLTAYAWFLPHGVSPAMIHYMNQKTVVAITQVLNAFGARRARFTPGWRPNAFWRIEQPPRRDVMVATWDHGAGKPVLAVVSNLQTEAEATVALRWTGPGQPRVVNARTGEALSVDDGGLSVTLAPESFILIRSE